MAVAALLCSFVASAADPAVPYTFSPADTAAGLTPTNAFLWADSANWTSDGGGWPGNTGIVADFSVTTLEPTRYILLPAGGIDIGGIKGGSKQRFIVGDELRIDSAGYSGSTYVAAGRINGGDNTFVFAPLDVKSEASGTFHLAGDWRMTTGNGKVTLSVGRIHHRADMYANDSNPVREQEVDMKEVYQGTGSIGFYGPRSSASALTSVWDQVSGSPFVKHVSGTTGSSLPVGTIVTGDGVQADTFLKRRFSDDWIELSKPVTLTTNSNSLVFAAFAPRFHSVIPKWTTNSGHQNNGIALGKYGKDDVLRIEIMQLSVSVGNYEYFPVVLPGSTTYAGTLVLHDTSNFVDKLRASIAHLELVPDQTTEFFQKSNGIFFENSGSQLRVTVTNSAQSASLRTISNIKGKLFKDGDGTLETGFADVSNTGCVVVEEGRLVMTNGTGEASVNLAQLCVSNGAVFALAKDCRLAITSSFDLQVGAAIELAEGARLMLPCGMIIPTGVSVTGAGVVAYQMSAGGEEALISAPEGRVVGEPAFWIDACSLTNAVPSGELVADGDDLRVARWDDCRGGAAQGYMFCTNVALKPKLVAGATPYVNIPNGSSYEALSALAWDKPLTNIRAVFAVISGFPLCRCGAILGSTRRMSKTDFLRGGNDNNNLFYPNNNTYVYLAPIYCDGVEKTYQNEKLNEGRLVVLEVHPTADSKADAFGMTDGNDMKNRFDLSGGGRVHEYIIYTNTLTYAERVAVADYLMMKWEGKHAVYEAADAAHRAGALSANGATLGVDVPEGGFATAQSFDAPLVKTGAGKLTIMDTMSATNIHVQAGEVELVSRDPLDKTKLPSAYLHLDATAENAFEWKTTDDGVKRVKKWNAASAGSKSAALVREDSTNAPTVKTVAALGGLPVVDFGVAATTNNWANNFNPSLSFTGTRDIQTIFAVHGSAGGGNSFLGGTSGRNDGPALAYLGIWRDMQNHVGDITRPIIDKPEGNNMDALRDLYRTEVKENGVVVNQATKGFTGGYCLYSVRSNSKMSGNRIAAVHYGQSYGGVEFGELMYLTHYLNQEEFDRTEAYFQKKWFGRVTPCWTPATAGEVIVDPGAALSLVGGAPLTARALGGGGTISGDVILDGEIVAVVASDGSVEGLTVTGSADVSAGGVVRFAGFVDALVPGRYPLVAATTLVSGGGWACVSPNSAFSAAVRVSAAGGSLVLVVAQKGLEIYFK
jgi:hypothetical protein